jgi:hypothetical protein
VPVLFRLDAVPYPAFSVPTPLPEHIKLQLPAMAQPVAQAAKKAIRTFRELHGVVISAGLMDKTVKVRVGGQKWNSFLKKVRFIIYHLPPSYLCPNPRHD